MAAKKYAGQEAQLAQPNAVCEAKFWKAHCMRRRRDRQTEFSRIEEQ
jgi:hypothetical protein